MWSGYLLSGKIVLPVFELHLILPWGVFLLAQILYLSDRRREEHVRRLENVTESRAVQDVHGFETASPFEVYQRL